MNDIVILLDLEDTIIKHWSTPHLINVEVIADYISEMRFNLHGADHHGIPYKLDPAPNVTVGIYSYALWCDENINVFKHHLQPEIEQALGVEIDVNYIFHMNELVEDFSRKNTPIGYGEYCSIINKEKSIMDFHIDHPLFANKDIILIDDTVTDGMNITYPSRFISFKNPYNMGP